MGPAAEGFANEVISTLHELSIFDCRRTAQSYVPVDSL